MAGGIGMASIVVGSVLNYVDLILIPLLHHLAYYRWTDEDEGRCCCCFCIDPGSRIQERRAQKKEGSTQSTNGVALLLLPLIRSVSADRYSLGWTEPNETHGLYVGLLPHLISTAQK